MEDIDLNERFYIFDNFLTSNEHVLKRGDKEWNSSKIFFQLAIEHADKSPLSIDADKFEEDGKVDFDYVRDVNRDEEIYISPLVAVLDDYSKRVTDIKILENLNIVTSYGDGTIRIWDHKSFECIVVLKGHQDRIRGIEINSDQNIISYSDDRIIRIWDNKSYECIAILEDDRNDNDIKCIKILENKNIISCEKPRLSNKIQNCNLMLWDYNTYKLLACLEGHENKINGIEIVSNNKIISYSDDRTIRVWDIENYKCLKVLNIDKTLNSDDIIILPNNNIVISYFAEVIILDSVTYEEIYTESFENRINKIIILDEEMIYLSIFDQEHMVMNFTTYEKKYATKEQKLFFHQKTNILLKNNKVVSRLRGELVIFNEDLKVDATIEIEHGRIVIIHLRDNLIALYGNNSKSVNIYNLNNIKYSKRLIKENYDKYTLLNNRDIIFNTRTKVSYYNIEKKEVLYDLEFNAKEIFELSDSTLLIVNSKILGLYTRELKEIKSICLSDIDNYVALESGNIAIVYDKKVVKIHDKYTFEVLNSFELYRYEDRIKIIELPNNKFLVYFKLLKIGIDIYNDGEYEYNIDISKSIKEIKHDNNKIIVSVYLQLLIYDINTYEKIRKIVKVGDLDEILENKNILTFKLLHDKSNWEFKLISKDDVVIINTNNYHNYIDILKNSTVFASIEDTLYHNITHANYISVVSLNKTIKYISDYRSTIIQSFNDLVIIMKNKKLRFIKLIKQNKEIIHAK